MVGLGMNGRYPSRRQMKRAFREGKGVYDDGQSSWSVNCQNARARGRRPLTEAIRIVRSVLQVEGIRVTGLDSRKALIKTHDGEWHHTSKYGNRTNYYDPGKAIELLRQERTHSIDSAPAQEACDTTA